MAIDNVSVVSVPEEALLELESSAAKLRAMLALACQDEGEPLRCLNPDIQRQFLNACEDAADSLRQAIGRLTAPVAI